MPPKKGKGPKVVSVVTEDEKQEELEGRRLQDLAFSKNVILGSPAESTTQAGLPSAFKGLDGADIVKRGSQQKNRYLFVFPGEFKPKSAGLIGELQRLNTLNPILYLNLPKGRLVLKGTMIASSNTRVIGFKASSRPPTGNINAEYDRVIAFSEVEAEGAEGSMEPVPAAKQEPDSPGRSTPAVDTSAVPATTPTRRSRREASRNKVVYTSAADSDDEEEDSLGEDDFADKESGEMDLPLIPASPLHLTERDGDSDSSEENAVLARSRKRTRIELDATDSEFDDEKREQTPPPARSAPARSTPRRASARAGGRMQYQDVSESEDSFVSSEDESEYSDS